MYSIYEYIGWKSSAAGKVGQTVVVCLLDAEAATLSKDYSVDVHPVFDFTALLNRRCESRRRIWDAWEVIQCSFKKEDLS